MFGEWSELCAKDDLRAPEVDDVELKAAADSVGERRRRRRKRSVAKDTVQVVKEEHEHKDLVSLKASPDIDAEEVEQTVPPHGQCRPLSMSRISQYHRRPYACPKETSRRPINTGTRGVECRACTQG